jgi:hypothetical protein
VRGERTADFDQQMKKSEKEGLRKYLCAEPNLDLMNKVAYLETLKMELETRVDIV